jgi:hypothetical protein
MITNIKKRILDAASAVARTKESECKNVPEFLRRRIDLWFDACEELIPEQIEVLKWIDTRDEVPTDNRNMLLHDGRHVWLGYWDADDETWRFENGQRTDSTKYWAEMPKGPEVTT